MSQPQQDNQTPEADFSPSKRFFVSMLTRDIDLNDAILDLLDNCVDGALRSNSSPQDLTQPYRGFEAKLTISKTSFQIEDNCGGIPKNARAYAFRMGRTVEHTEGGVGTVGVYGIGMKRAIFKIGTRAKIYSNHVDGAFEIDISPDWTKNESWVIPLVEKKFLDEQPKGTTINITDLNPNISRKFSEDTYLTDLYDQIRHSLSFIIQKGFSIKLNGNEIKANPITLMSDGKHIEPYIYKADIDGVKVDLAVGFYKNLESEDEDDANSKRSSEDAGWTVICNDRVVLYCDKTYMTGWGHGKVPKFHTQFIAISGVVRFTSNDPEKLPITTTKRGVDLGSALYNDVRNKMMEGMLHFTKFTNQWKGEHLEEGKRILEKAQPALAQKFLDDITQNNITSTNGKWSNPNHNPNESRFIPNLPVPKTSNSKVRITFTKEIEDVKILSEYFYGIDDHSPSDIGSLCFDKILGGVK
ncbi:ATP-binding protein [Yersinia enterocolitica]